MKAENPPVGGFSLALFVEPNDVCDAKEFTLTPDAPSSQSLASSLPSLPLPSPSPTPLVLTPRTRNTLPALVATNRLPWSPTLVVRPKLSPVIPKLLSGDCSKLHSTRKGWNSA